MAVDKVDAYLGRASGMAVTTLAVTGIVVPADTTSLAVHVSVRQGGSNAITMSLSGVASSWLQVDQENDTQLVLRGRVYDGVGPFTDGTITLTSDTALEAVVITVWAIKGGDTTTPTDAIGSDHNGATDTATPSTTVTPTVADTLILAHGSSRNGDLATAGTGYTITMNGFLVGTGGTALRTWAMERTAAAPSAGTPTTVDGTLASAREWIIFGQAIKPGSSAEPDVRHGTSSLSVPVTLAASGHKVATGGSVLDFTPTPAATGHKVAHGSTALASPVTLTTTGHAEVTDVRHGSSSLAAAVTLTATGRKVAQGATSLTAPTALTTTGHKTARGATSLTVTVTLTTSGHNESVDVRHGSSSLSAPVTLTSSGHKAAVGRAEIAAPVALTTTGRKVAAGRAVLAVTTTLTSTGHKVGRGSSVLLVPVTLTSRGVNPDAISPTPAERTVVVAPETRVTTTPADPRTVAVPAENRTVTA